MHGCALSSVGPGRRLIPIDWLGWIVLALTLFCATLNFLRGMSILSHGHIDVSLLWQPYILPIHQSNGNNFV